MENIVYTFKVNKRFYFTKSLKEVSAFCKEYTTKISNPLVKGIGELFSFCAAENPGNVSANNFSLERGTTMLPNFETEGGGVPSSIDLGRRYKALHMELESSTQQLEGYLRHILNDPDLYSDVVYKFFNCHQIFQMIPHVAHFRDLNKALLTQNSSPASQKSRQYSQ